MDRSSVGTALRRARGGALWLAAAVLLSLPALSAADGKMTIPELLQQFSTANPHQRLELLPRIAQPSDKADFERYKIPDFLNRTLRDVNEDPRVRQAALEGMVDAIKKYSTEYRAQFIPALLDVLNEKSGGLVQEYVLLACPAVVDPDSPGPNKLLLSRISAIAADTKLVTDNEVRRRVQSIVALGEIGNKDYLDTFFKLMSDPNKQVIAAAVTAVGKFLDTPPAMELELTQPQISTLTTLLKNKDTSLDSVAAILTTLGVNARNFRRAKPANQTAPAMNEVMEKIKSLFTTPKAGESLPPFYVVGACIETLGMYGQKEAIDIIKRIIAWDYLQTPEGQPYRVKAVDVLDQVIAANIGKGEAFNQTVADIGDLLVTLLNDDKEDMQVRQAAAFYLGDIRFKCYKRTDYFGALFAKAYVAPDAKGVTLDNGLAQVCRKSMEMIADRTFPADWTYADFLDWAQKVGKTELAQK